MPSHALQHGTLLSSKLLAACRYEKVDEKKNEERKKKELERRFRLQHGDDGDKVVTCAVVMLVTFHVQCRSRSVRCCLLTRCGALHAAQI